MRRFTCVIGAALVAALSIPAYGQTWNSHPHPDNYDPYVGIRNREGMSCCNGQDCRQALPEELFNVLPEGGYVVRGGTDVPPGTFIREGLTANSPDANYHLCMTGEWDTTRSPARWNPRGGKVRCLMLPVGGS